VEEGGQGLREVTLVQGWSAKRQPDQDEEEQEPNKDEEGELDEDDPDEEEQDLDNEDEWVNVDADRDGAHGEGRIMEKTAITLEELLVATDDDPRGATATLKDDLLSGHVSNAKEIENLSVIEGRSPRN
jgi:hypothetical protein